MNSLLNKRRVAAALKRAPFVLTLTHRLWRLTLPRYTVGVMGIVFDNAGRVLLVEHVYHVQPQWGLPGGYVDRGEALEDAVVRELREELALSIRVGQVVLVERSVRRHLDIAYLCAADSVVGAVSAELLGFDWFMLEALPPVRPFHKKAIRAAALLQEKSQV